MTQHFKIILSAMLYTGAFLYPSYLAGGLFIALILINYPTQQEWCIWWGIFYGTMHYPIYLFCSKEWGVLIGGGVYILSVGYALGSAILIIFSIEKIITHRLIRFASSMFCIFSWQEYGLIVNPFANPLVPLCAWLPYSTFIVSYAGWIILLVVCGLFYLRALYGVVLLMSLVIPSFFIPTPQPINNIIMPRLQTKDIQYLLEYCFDNPIYNKKIVIFPESFCNSTLDQNSVLIKSIKDYACYDPCIILGARRQSSDPHCLHTTLFVLTKNGIEEHFDKLDCLYGAEINPFANSIMPGNAARKPLKNGWMPYLCSELFWASYLDNNYPLICLVHDSWPATAWMAELMLLKARLLAVQHKATIIYCSYCYKAQITKSFIRFI